MSAGFAIARPARFILFGLLLNKKNNETKEIRKKPITVLLCLCCLTAVSYCLLSDYDVV